mmetsp:Transcript_46782/g.95274  ORF Transcript_46782/g.95274 Transcript_46782/m.95274 type:complete len:201 (-) Transcript_46782:275-877(-)
MGAAMRRAASSSGEEEISSPCGTTSCFRCSSDFPVESQRSSAMMSVRLLAVACHKMPRPAKSVEDRDPTVDASVRSVATSSAKNSACLPELSDIFSTSGALRSCFRSHSTAKLAFTRSCRAPLKLLTWPSCGLPCAAWCSTVRPKASRQKRPPAPWLRRAARASCKSLRPSAACSKVRRSLKRKQPKSRKTCGGTSQDSS